MALTSELSVLQRTVVELRVSSVSGRSGYGGIPAVKRLLGNTGR
jgi:hypothetical protein